MKTATRRELTKSEEIELLRECAAELQVKFADPVHGKEETKRFLIRCGILRKSGKVVPYFAHLFGEGWADDFSKP